MRLARPFYKLALRINLDRLRSEVAALPEDAWVAHPNRIDGNTSVRLISAGGGENDEVHGPMAPTAHLKGMPYVRQLLADFGVVWSRSRLMQLAPRAQVPEHADINFHWFNRVRIHIPVITNPQVRFHCGDQAVHMGEGEVWLFDNWRLHRVENQSDQARIHLVADTTGSASFWRYVADSMRPDVSVRQHLFDPNRDAQVLTERQPPWPVLHPAEIELVTQDLRREFLPAVDDSAGRERAATLGLLLEELTQDWRQVYSIHGQDRSGWSTYLSLRDGLRKSCAQLLNGIIAKTNGIDALSVLEGRLLRAVLHLPPEADPGRGAAREP
jgi:hypothetical protein